MVRLLHKAAARMRQLGYWAQRMIVEVRFIDGARWERKVALGLCRETLTMVARLKDVWPPRMHGKPMKVAITLVDLVADRNATGCLFEDQQKLDALADAMDRIDDRFGRHTIHSAAMCGHRKSAPTRISFTSIPRDDEFLNSESEDG